MRENDMKDREATTEMRTTEATIEVIEIAMMIRGEVNLQGHTLH